MIEFDPAAPVIIGVGEASRKTVPGDWPSPRELAGAAIKAALADTGQPQGVAAAIDTIAAIRTFEDSGVSMGTGSPDNVPEAFGVAGCISAKRLIYADVGGQSPQAMVNRLAGEIRRGETGLAVIVAGEATGTAKRARKAGIALDWRLPSDTPFADQRSEFSILARREIRHGIVSMPIAYSLLENARRIEQGLSRHDYLVEMARQGAAMSAKSLTREHAQFPMAFTAEQLVAEHESDYHITDIYRRWRVAQDAVDLGGAIILASAGKARELGVAEHKIVWLAGASEAAEPPLSERDHIASPDAVGFTLRAALDQAGFAPTDLGPVDIYSCFPVAVSAAVDTLGDPARTLGDYTLTGGLGFFGGPGNGYTVYSIAAMVQALRGDGSKPALITANGGVMSKQAVGVYTAQQPQRPWNGDVIKGYVPKMVAVDDSPQGMGRILTYARPVTKGVMGDATLILEMGSGARALAVLEGAPDIDLGGIAVDVTPGEKRHAAKLIG
jgi:acetyl-CoA C-acetyltransferase